MRPAFSTYSSALRFLALLLVILLSPSIVPASWLPSREQTYASQNLVKAPFPWLQHVIFEEKGPIDVALLGSSRILFSLDAVRFQEQLSQRLGRPATVRVLGWMGSGFDIDYFIAKDLLAHREVRHLIFYDDFGPNRNNLYPALFRFQEDAGDLAGLSLAAKCRYYFASLAMLPRNLLCNIRPNFRADLHGPTFSYTLDGAQVVDQLGSLKLAAYSDTGSGATGPYAPFTPQTQASPSDVRIYSPETAGDFVFESKPLASWETHFIHLFSDLARQHRVSLAMLNIPQLEEIRNPQLVQRTDWRNLFGPDLVMVGVLPEKMFHGLSNEDTARLFWDPMHLNANGQEYFSSIITPALLDICSKP